MDIRHHTRLLQTDACTLSFGQDVTIKPQWLNLEHELCRFPPQAWHPVGASHAAAAATSAHTVPDAQSPAEPEDAAAASSAPKQRKRDPASAHRESAQPQTPMHQSPEAAHVHAADAQPAVSKHLGWTGDCTPEAGAHLVANQGPERGSGRLSELAEVGGALLPPEADDAPGRSAWLARDGAACSGPKASPTSAAGDLERQQGTYCSNDAEEAGGRQDLSSSCEVLEPAGDYDSDAFWTDDGARGFAAPEEPCGAGGAGLSSQPMQKCPKDGRPGGAGGRKGHKPYRLEHLLPGAPWDMCGSDDGARPAPHQCSGPQLVLPANEVLPTAGAMATNEGFSRPGGWQWVAPATDIERAGVTRVEQAWRALLTQAQHPRDPPAREGAAGPSCGACTAITSLEAAGERPGNGAAGCSGSGGGRGAAAVLPTFPMLCRLQLRLRVLVKRQAAGLQDQQASQPMQECGEEDLLGQVAEQQMQQQPQAGPPQPTAALTGRPPAALTVDAPPASVPQSNVLAEAAAWQSSPERAAMTPTVPPALIPSKPDVFPPSIPAAAAGHLVRQQHPPPRARRERKPTARWLGWFAEQDPATAGPFQNANLAHAVQMPRRQQLLPPESGMQAPLSEMRMLPGRGWLPGGQASGEAKAGGGLPEPRMSVDCALWRKQCGSCRQWRPVGQFWLNHHSIDGLEAECAECMVHALGLDGQHAEVGRLEGLERGRQVGSALTGQVKHAGVRKRRRH